MWEHSRRVEWMQHIEQEECELVVIYVARGLV